MADEPHDIEDVVDKIENLAEELMAAVTELRSRERTKEETE